MPKPAETTGGSAGKPHVALHLNRNTFRGSWEITAVRSNSQTILS